MTTTTRPRFTPDADTAESAARPALEVHAEYDQIVSVLSLRGELDIAATPRLEHALAHCLAEVPQEILLDLTELHFMDVVGMRAVLRASERCDAKGCRLVVLGAGAPVRRLLQVAGVTGRLLLVD